jgi:hypothetical protein
MPRRKNQKSYYKLTEVMGKIDNGLVTIRENARQRAYKDFGWETPDILDAFRKLRTSHFLKSANSNLNYSIMLDFYKAHIKGEDIYTHFYFSDDKLVINSFHKR